MLSMSYYSVPELLLLPIIAIPSVVWVLARKAKALNAQGPGFSHRAKRNWCYVLIAAFILEEIAMIAFFFHFSGELSGFAGRVQFIIDDVGYLFALLVWIYTFLLWGVALGPLLIWWNVVGKKELSTEQPDDYKQRNRRCNIWIVIGAAWFVLGLLDAATLLRIYYVLMCH